MNFHLFGNYSSRLLYLKVSVLFEVDNLTSVKFTHFSHSCGIVSKQRIAQYTTYINGDLFVGPLYIRHVPLMRK